MPFVLTYPSRMTAPARSPEVAEVRPAAEEIGRPLADVITSPAVRPEREAAVPGSTPQISAPEAATAPNVHPVSASAT
jgi:hypothetical protein